jgi:hypothetical protein
MLSFEIGDAVGNRDQCDETTQKQLLGHEFLSF